MGKKEDMLMMGSLYFLVAWAIFAMGMFFYVFNRTQNKTYKASNAMQVLRFSMNNNLIINLLRLSIGLTFMAFVCMWSFWAMSFMLQMNPLLAPSVAVGAHS